MSDIDDEIRASLRRRAQVVSSHEAQAWERVTREVGLRKRTNRPRRSTALRIVPAVVASVAILVFLTLITLGTRLTRETPSKTVSITAFADAVGQFRVPDYEPADTPTKLADEADIVVAGSIIGVAPGQSYAPTPESPAVLTTSVIEVQVDDVVSGNAELLHGGSVYIELTHPAYVGTGEDDGVEVPFDHAAFARTVPIGARGIFFLADRTTEPYWKTVLDEGAGRPNGASITAAYVQGFILEESPGGSIVSILEPFEAMPPSWRGFANLSELSDRLS